ncbi:MAG: OB-fold nucleic acid binding domain-containing protein, partial [Nitrospinota bacterium]
MRFIESFKPGEEVTSFFLVGGKSIRDSRQGRPFLELTLKDSSGSIGAKYWDVPEDLALSVNPGDYVKVMGRVELFNEVPQLI